MGIFWDINTLGFRGKCVPNLAPWLFTGLDAWMTEKPVRRELQKRRLVWEKERERDEHVINLQFSTAPICKDLALTYIVGKGEKKEEEKKKETWKILIPFQAISTVNIFKEDKKFDVWQWITNLNAHAWTSLMTFSVLQDKTMNVFFCFAITKLIKGSLKLCPSKSMHLPMRSLLAVAADILGTLLTLPGQHMRRLRLKPLLLLLLLPTTFSKCCLKLYAVHCWRRFLLLWIRPG